ncbi:MAG: glutathione S-transferase N-terminal domain-containing protein [Chitinophagaceae bacterium]|nr:glutathione S-transferase N-terminal domain-containing protein [Oligoflexus sp.]
MHLYYSPGACSMVPHIILEELGLKYEAIPVNLKDHTYLGGDFYKVNPKGYVPTLELDTKQVLTENIVILQYLAEMKPEAKLLPSSGIERFRHLEMLTFITTEIHKSFGPIFNDKVSDADKDIYREHLKKRFAIVDKQLEGKSFLMGSNYSLPDAYLFVMTRWAKAKKVDIGGYLNISKHFEAVQARPATQRVIALESGKK